MKFENIKKKELVELNLYPIPNFKKLQECCTNGYYYITNRCGTLMSSARNYTDVDEKFQISSFTEMKREELENFGFTQKSLFKLLWLQKYLNCEVDGIYSPQDDDEYLSFTSTEEICRLHERISSLEMRLQKYVTENKELKEKVLNIEKERKSLEKTKEQLIKVIDKIKYNQTMLDEILFELQE